MMNQSPLSWDLIATYLAVRQTHSLSAAARRLHLSQPTVRRQIEALEAQLGVTLFTRSTTGLMPAPGTDGLHDLGAQIQAMADAFARRAAVAATPDRGRVRVSCSEIFATEILPPIIASLRGTYPSLIVELSVTNRTEDILQRAADIAIRLTSPQQDALVAQKVGRFTVGLYAAPGLVDADMGYACFQQHGPFVGEDRDTLIADGFRALGLPPPAHVVFRSDSHAAQLSALRAGVGAGICQDRLATGLVRICADVTFALDTWVIMHEDLRHFGPVRRVFDHLVAALR
jgi:DNA-binding transcriptional LysR family regulator